MVRIYHRLLRQLKHCLDLPLLSFSLLLVHCFELVGKDFRWCDHLLLVSTQVQSLGEGAGTQIFLRTLRVEREGARLLPIGAGQLLQPLQTGLTVQSS